MLLIKTKRSNFIADSTCLVFIAIAIVVVSFCSPVIPSADAASETVVSGGSISGRVNQQIAITNVSINGTGNDTIPVKLQVQHGTLYMTTTTGISFVGVSAGSTISFTGTRNNVNAALATLHYAGTSAGADTLTVSLADSNTIYNATTGHVYQYVPNSMSWFDARDAAAASNYEGIPGYLATITSAAENNFIKDRLNGDAWLGGSDDSIYAGEGHWDWVTGPEANTNIYNGEGSAGAGGGTTVNGQYTNWAAGEPNNADGDENCMETYISDGSWNDLPCSAMVNGYVVEYGGPSANPSAIPSIDVSITTTAAVFAGGDGSTGSPYQVTDCERLQDLNQDLSAHYVLTHDIDCTDTPNWNGGQGFVPIGSNEGSNSPFTGTLTGNGYNIDGLTQIRADDDSNTDYNSNPATNQRYVGLFGYGVGLQVTDVHLINAKIKGYEFVGGVIGYMTNGMIDNVTVNKDNDESANASCTPGYCVWARYGNYGGGIVGWMVGGSITHSQVGGLVKGSGNYIGGLAGHMEDSAAISTSSSSAAIDGGYSVGGIVGEMYSSSSLHRVYATGNVISKFEGGTDKIGWYAGGLVGQANNVSISESYATGSVHTDQNSTGGIGGYINNSRISDTYSTSRVSSDGSLAGGLIGMASNNTISRTYSSGHISAVFFAGGLLGSSFQDTVTDSFTNGEITSSASKGAVTPSLGGVSLSEFYYDVTSTGISAANCDVNGTVAGCTAVNTNGLQTGYFNDYRNTPFKQANTQVWDINNIWYFSGTALPILRLGTVTATSALPPVDDHDSISTAVENAAPNNGDGNNDGIRDSEQSNVVSFVNPVTSKYMTLEVNNSCSIMAVSNTIKSNGGDQSYSYPFGLLNYTLNCGMPGSTTNVTVYYHNLANANGMSVRKYNPTTNTYSNVAGAVISGGNPVKISYSVTDGGLLDEDGIVNGVIVDPVGLATLERVNAPNTGLKSQDIVITVITGVAGIVALSTVVFLSFRAQRKNVKK